MENMNDDGGGKRLTVTFYLMIIPRIHNFMDSNLVVALKGHPCLIFF